MSSASSQLEQSTIERWVKAVEFETSANVEDLSNEHGWQTMEQLREQVYREEIAKRSKPSYNWQPFVNDTWWRIWFKEDDLTIQIDQHLPNGEYRQNQYEIDLEGCKTPLSFLEQLYRVSIGKQWSCPEMLWAIMEVSQQASEKVLKNTLVDAYSRPQSLNWRP